MTRLTFMAVSESPSIKKLQTNTFNATNLTVSRAIYIGNGAEITDNLKLIKLFWNFYSITSSLSTLEKEKNNPATQIVDFPKIL